MSTSEWPELTSETREFWDQNATFWDEYIGEGNHFHNQLIRPTVERLLAIKPGEVVLDVACGNGNFSRRLATLGATDEPNLPLETFDVSASDYDDLVEKLT